MKRFLKSICLWNIVKLMHLLNYIKCRKTALIIANFITKDIVKIVLYMQIIKQPINTYSEIT